MFAQNKKKKNKQNVILKRGKNFKTDLAMYICKVSRYVSQREELFLCSSR